ncbi:MAG: regulatory iron-sulfur-containing complex subunit RicT [Planctomycetaceae bacterium]
MTGGFIVRFGSNRQVAEFSVKGNQEYARSTDVIVRSNRGVEWGEVLCPASEKTKTYLGTSEVLGRILRRASDQDYQRRDELGETERAEFESCKEIVAEHKLQMQLVDIEHIFGGERIVIYYLAEKRVDFRALVKVLAKKFRTRIEMRQIGVRDEAKLLADYGDCGKPVCCGTHLTEMPPVSMKMAKLQKATLDPNKISGRCGRLKCCLRYEYETYNEYQRELPRIGAGVVLKEGQGKVIGQEILAQKVLVLMENHRRLLVSKSDILTVIKSSGKSGKKSTEGTSSTP